MERVSLFIDFYNFIISSNNYLNQKCFLDFTKIQEYFIDSKTQIYSKTYLYGGADFDSMLRTLNKKPRIDYIPGENGSDKKKKNVQI